jgi:hypothetical protein
MESKTQCNPDTANSSGAGAMGTVRMTEVKFPENAQAQQYQGVLAEAPRAAPPVGKPVVYRPDGDPLGDPLTVHEVSRLLGCSAWTVRNRHMRRGLPYFRMGGIGKLVFYRGQVTHWILEQQALQQGRR